SEPAAASRARPVNNAALERLASVSERVQARPAPSALTQPAAKKEAYRWKATTPVEEVKKEEVATPKALKKALEHEKTPELSAKLAAESLERDPWAAEVSQMALPKLVEQVALNAWKEQDGNAVCLHLRPTQRHLNSPGAKQKLAEAMSSLYGAPVELTIVEDDNPAVRTPLEWRQAIYEEKLAQARESIIADNNIQTLRRFFDADLDEESIRPI
ncbi:DNA polymerase III subunit gamma/tau C-terminal domain-containing protein, partial [Kluyvera sp.]